MQVRCPDHSDPLGGDIVGCGAVFEAEPDHEGLIDCPECGIVFSPQREQLPIWANTSEARDLLASIVADPPEAVISRGTWIEGGGNVHYRGRTAAKLRRIHADWLEREFAAMDAAYAVDPASWDQTAADALFRVDDADKLIERLTHEPMVEVGSDPLRAIAA